MEALNGHDENFSMQFVNSWENRRVTILWYLVSCFEGGDCSGDGLGYEG